MAACCVWGCAAADQSERHADPSTTQSAYSEDHVKIRTGPWSNGRRWPGLMNQVFFDIMWTAGCVCVVYLEKRCTKMHYEKKVSWWRQCDDLGDVLLGNLESCIHVDVTLTRTTYLNIAADQVHHFMVTVFPNGNGLFQQDNAPWHTAKIVQEWFEDQEHDKEFKVLTWPPNSPDLSPIQHLGMCWKNKPDHGGPTSNFQDLKDLLLMPWCQIPQDTFRGLWSPCLHGSE
ncbi:hypothetical protein LDENG_00283840, partial [Lucifuga dentata]